MRKLLLLVGLLVGLNVNSQISVFPYSQSFSNVVPADFTSTTPNGWKFTSYNNNSNSHTGNYSARIDDKNKYMYISLSVKYGYTYKLTFWSKNICELKWNVNNTPDQNSLLLQPPPPNINDIDGCKDEDWTQSTITYTPLYTGIMYFQISARDIEDDHGYIDDILITETAPVSLPISLLYFGGKSIGEYNRLYWSTASETNNDYFLLHRSFDGHNFNLVSKVNGAGTSTMQLYYEVNDYVLYDGISYYRLKQVDINGDEVEFDLISIDNRLKSSPVLVKVTNIMGQVVEDFKASGILLYHYDDGSVIKRYIE